MKIAFNFHGVGVGNNGGTRTVLKSAMTLAKMGHDIEIWSDGPNCFDWFELEGVRYCQGKMSDMGHVDALIATGQASADSTSEYDDKEVGAYWVRGYETWSASEEELARTYSLGLRMMANSVRLVDKIKEVSGVEASLVRPGLETDFFTMGDSYGVKLGALYSPKAMKRARDVAYVFRKVKEITGVSTVLMSAYDVPSWFSCDEVVKNPSEEEKREMYRSVAVWYAPTDNDGLHLPPMESGLCGAALVAHGIPESGMLDYARHGDTALLYDTGNLGDAVTQVIALLDNDKLRWDLSISLRDVLKDEIGSREYNMEKMVKALS